VIVLMLSACISILYSKHRVIMSAMPTTTALPSEPCVRPQTTMFQIRNDRFYNRDIIINPATAAGNGNRLSGFDGGRQLHIRQLRIDFAGNAVQSSVVESLSDAYHTGYFHFSLFPRKHCLWPRASSLIEKETS